MADEAAKVEVEPRSSGTAASAAAAAARESNGQDASSSGTGTSSSGGDGSVFKRKPVVVIVIGMAGSGKTTLMQRLNAHLHQERRHGYVINLDPAVTSLPYGAHIDIRDTVNYKNVMKEYHLGPNGGILTSLNLFATKFDEVIELVERRAPELDYVLVDTPGQIEIFTWSASGAIITEAFASTFPTVIAYVVDTPRSTSPITFMSNMLYACSILYKTKLPLLLTFNKTDIERHDFAVEWMDDFEAFQAAIAHDASYSASLSQSLCLVLDEFYRNLRNVGVSAVTGAGTADFFTKVNESADEFMRTYKVELDERRAEKKRKEEEKQAADMARLRKDLEENKGKTVVLEGRKGKDEAADIELGVDEDNEDDDDDVDAT